MIVDEQRQFLAAQRVADEDISIFRAVQRGAESEAADDGGVLSPAYETCIASFYHHLVAALSD